MSIGKKISNNEVALKTIAYSEVFSEMSKYIDHPFELKIHVEKSKKNYRVSASLISRPEIHITVSKNALDFGFAIEVVCSMLAKKLNNTKIKYIRKRKKKYEKHFEHRDKSDFC